MHEMPLNMSLKERELVSWIIMLNKILDFKEKSGNEKGYSNAELHKIGL